MGVITGMGAPALSADVPGIETARFRGIAEPGAFCPLGSCRAAPASPWTPAAFGTVVLAIGWTARSRETG